jgi:voltage-gated potassium channel
VALLDDSGTSVIYGSPELERWRRRTDGPLLVLAIGTLPILLLEVTRSKLPIWDQRFIDAVNIIVLVAFAVDYVVELRLSSNRRAFVRHEWVSLAIVVAQAIAVVPSLAGFGALRAVRGVRAVRAIAVVLRLVAIGGAAATRGRSVLRRRAATFALSLAALTWLTSAVAFTLFEDVGEDGRVHSFFDALWWSTATITTVGYGDLFPVTFGGRMVGVVTMVVGISSFAVVTAKIAEFLVRTDDAGTRAEEP